MRRAHLELFANPIKDSTLDKWSVNPVILRYIICQYSSSFCFLHPSNHLLQHRYTVAPRKCRVGCRDDRLFGGAAFTLVDGFADEVECSREEFFIEA